MATIPQQMSRSVFSSNIITSTTSSPDIQIESMARGAILYVDVTAFSGTIPTLLISIESKDPVSGKYISVPGLITGSITGISTTALTIGSGLTGVANSVINTVLPNTFRITATIGGTAPSFTLSVGMQFTY